MYRIHQVITSGRSSLDVFLSRDRALRDKDDIQARIRTISVLAVLLQGPFDTGNAILGSQNLVELMLQMADSGDPLQEVIIGLFFQDLFPQICCWLAYRSGSNRSVRLEEGQSGRHPGTGCRHSEESLSLDQWRYPSARSSGENVAVPILSCLFSLVGLGSSEDCL